MMHQRISKKIFIYLLIFSILVTVNNKKLTFDFYKIKKFNIVSSYDLNTDKIYKELINFTNYNIFSFDKQHIYKIISSNKAVEYFQVSKVYPSTLNIEIIKTQFLAITKKDNVDYFIGANGNLIEKNDNNYDLPYVFGNINVNDFLHFKNIVDNSNIKFTDFENIYYFNSNRWDVVNKEGIVLKLPHKLSVEKLNLIFKIIKKNELKDLKIFDFRLNNMMIINE